eukprot:m.82304 g.82304  ORF g.82304 m.82304 type:complete len:137 (-) comp14613_c1_seq2:968-1378(-)
MPRATITLDRVIHCPVHPKDRNDNLAAGCWGQTSFGTLTYNGKSVRCNAAATVNYNWDVTVSSANCYEAKHSNEFNVTMPHAVGPVDPGAARGIYIHEYPLQCSAGCIHLETADAKAFYDWVKAQPSVRIVVKSTF